MTIAPERLPAHSESPRAVEALIREARRRQHRRYSAIIGAVFLVVGAAVLASGGWGTSKPSVHGGGQTGGNSLVIPSKLQLHAEMVAGLFPTSAADFTKGEQFISLVNALQVQRRAACLTRAGFPSTIRVISPGTGIGDNTEFPDTSRISARGLNSGSQQLARVSWIADFGG